MSFQEELYNEHRHELFTSYSLNDFSIQDVERITDRLLSILPNNGKFYKYRSIEGQAFDNTFDSLKNGYLWIARADTLDDDTDCTIQFNPINDINAFFEMIIQNPSVYLKNITNDKRVQNKIVRALKGGLMDKLKSCYNEDTKSYDRDQVTNEIASFIYDFRQTARLANMFFLYVDSKAMQMPENVRNSVGSFVNINELNRKSTYIFSLSDDYDSNILWSTYANSNQGFCIEYDYKKTKCLPLNEQRMLMCFFKVIYDEVKEFSFSPTMDYVAKGRKDNKEYKKINEQILMNFITKGKDFAWQKEWRIILLNLKDSKLYADMVSGLIIDKRVMWTENAKQLLELAKERGWSVKIRSKDVIGTKHVYKEISL